MAINYPTRVVLLDRHALVRTGLRQHFEQLHGLTVTADFAAPADLFEHLCQHAVHAIILDCFQKEHAMTPEALLAAIRARSACRIVVFSTETSSCASARCMQAGADAFIDKREQVATLVNALRSVVELAPTRCLCGDSSFLISGLYQLSPAEAEVLRRVAQGMGTVEISEALGKARSTVSAHKWSALRKLGVRSELEFLKLLPPGFQWPWMN